jgi:hypothetical protein
LTSSVLRPWTTAIAALGAATLVACTGSSNPAPHTSATSASPTSRPTPTLTAAEQLQQVARAATRAVFHATYHVHRDKPGSNATLRVDHTKRSVRVDITAGATTATLIAAPGATFACRRSHGRRACFRVATKGERTPTPFNLAPANLFTREFARLAAHPKRYDITAAGSHRAKGDVPASRCYRVRATTGPKPERRPVTYCFSTKGVLTLAQYASGNVIRLSSLRQRVPKDAFRPYSSPTPIPH